MREGKSTPEEMNAATGRIRALAAAALSAITAIAGVLLLWTPFGEGLSNASYDSLHSLIGINASAFNDSQVVIVYLDLPSYLQAHQDPMHAWPREMHASLVKRLTAAGAKAVVFDIVFGGASSDAQADEALANAMRANGHVILAAEFNNKSSRQTGNDQPWLRMFKLDPPYEPFAKAVAGWGIASQRVDDDFVVRHQLAGYTSPENPTLVWVTAGESNPTTTNNAGTAGLSRWMRYYGPPLTLPHVSYVQAIDPMGVPDEFFRDKIVFIGSRPVAGLFQARQDEFRSPFHSFRNKELFMPGVEVHATELLNLNRGDWLRRLAPANETLLLLATGILFGAGLIRLRPFPATVAALLGIGLTGGAAGFGFSRNVWFPWIIVAGVQFPCALFGSWLYQFQKWFFTRREMEAAKRVADARIREQAALISKANDAILVQDLAGKIVYANPSAERLYQWTLPELQRAEIAIELFALDAANAARALDAAARLGEWNGELRQQTRGGQIVIVASRWTLLTDEAGKSTGILIINTDITGQKELEQQFLRSQRMNTIGTLAGGMAHDLNNALAPILMGAQLLRRTAPDEHARLLLELMETNTRRGADMVRQVLLFARGRGADFERIDSAALVREMEKIVRETFSRGITVESFLPADLWPLNGNSTQLHQVLLNLCVNARDAMPEGGKLSLVADNVELDASEAAAIPGGRPGRFVSLAVCDTGGGIPAEVLGKIFEPFFTTKSEGQGTGIGLATVVRIVKAHEGFLRVESSPGQGATFEVFLPRSQPAEHRAPEFSETELIRGNGELLLVADDELAIRELMTAELTSHGYKVLSAGDGAEAVALFKQQQTPVRLLIADHSMPLMTGVQALEEMRRVAPDLPAILTSGEVEGLAAPNTVALRKPFTLPELLQTVAECLGKGPGDGRTKYGVDPV